MVENFAKINKFMKKGSLTMGDISLNYLNTNTSGLMLECLNNTEIAVYDSGKRIIFLVL